uniref:Uncharacterized protein n=1 Tax=Anguilla anguilla TaxID=7936 RepID=A0A0E9QXW7_ANGAN
MLTNTISPRFSATLMSYESTPPSQNHCREACPVRLFAAPLRSYQSDVNVRICACKPLCAGGHCHSVARHRSPQIRPTNRLN